MRFRDLFSVFSRRTGASQRPEERLTDSFRSRVLMRCRDAYSGGNSTAFWNEIHTKLSYLLGSPRLTNDRSTNRIDEVISFLTTCADENFLDFIEILFRVDSFFQAGRRDEFVQDINEFLRVDDLPYAVTDFVWTKGTVVQFGNSYETTTLTEYPRVIRRDSELLYDLSIKPALELLGDSRFKLANAEFLDALEEFRKGDLGDSLTKCGSALESVLKVICDTNGWSYGKGDTAAPLIRTVVDHSKLDAFWEQPLMLIATIRNRLSKAHGAGASPREVPREVAEYAINATAGAALLLIRTTT